MDDFEPIDINFYINSPQVKSDAAVVKEEVTGVAVTAEKVAETTSRKVRETVEKSQSETAIALEKTKEKYEEMAVEAGKSFDKIAPGVSNQLAKLIELEQEINRITQAEKQLASQYDRGVIEQDDFARSAVGLRDKLLAAKMEMKAVSAEIMKQGQPIAQQKAQWNGLGNSINQISRELPAFTYSAQTGFMAVSNNIPILVDEINRLKVSNAAAAASGAATIPVWKAVGAAIFSWGTAISLIITLVTVFGKEIGAFITGLFKTSDAIDQVKRSQEAMNEAFKSSEVTGAIEEMIDLKTNLDLAKQGLIDQKTVIDQYNDSIGKTTSYVTTLNGAEQGIIDNADNYIKATLYKAAAEASRKEAAEKMIELIKEEQRIQTEINEAPEKTARASNYSAATSGSMGAPMISDRVIAIQKEKDLQVEKQKNLDLQKKEMDGVNELDKLFKSKIGDLNIDFNGEESNYNKITSDIKKTNEKYATAGLARAEKEIQTVKDTYTKLKEEAAKFNADPKNQARLIDVSGLDAAEQNAIAAIQEKNQKDQGTKVTTEHRNLLDKIAAIDQEYARKSFSKDEEELQALRDKFGKVRELVERFNANPKNKTQRIDLAGFEGVQNQAEGELKFRQETATLTKEITKQKAIFQDFENYKLKFGTEKAKEQYGEQIGEYESYMDYLRGLINQNQDTYTAITTGNASGGQTERYSILEKEAEAVNRLNLDKHAKLLEQNQTYQDKLIVMEETYLATRAALLEDGNIDEVAVLDRHYAEEVDKLEDANIKKSEAYKNLFLNVQRMTVANARQLIAAMDEELKKHKLSATEIAKIEERKARLLRLIRSQSLEDISKIAGALGSLGAALSEVGNSGSGIAEIGNLMSGLAGGVNDVLVAFDDDATSTDQIAAGINGVVKLVGMLAGAAKARKTAEEEYYRSVIGFQNEYNLSLNEQIRLQSMLNESVFLADYEGRIKDGLSALKNANEEYQNSLAALSGGQAKTGQRNAVDWGNVGQGAAAGAAAGAAIGTVIPVIGNAVGLVVGGLIGGLAGLFGGKKKKDTFVPLLEEYNELIQVGEDGVSRLNRELAETLIAQNLVDDSTKALIEDVLAWEDAAKAAREQVTGVVKDLVGQLGGDVRNALVQAFRDGEDAALALGATVEKVLEDMVSQIIFNKIFSDQFKQLEEEMVSSYDPGGDGNWIDDFSRFFEASKGLGEDFNQAMKDAQASASASGFNIFQPTGSESQKSAIQAGIERITEETGLELAGLTRANYDLFKRTFDLTGQRFALEQRLYENSVESYRYTVMIERNTAQTVVEMQLALIELKTIARNTKKGQTAYDLGG